MSITVSAIRRAFCLSLFAASALLVSCSPASAQSDAAMYKTQSISAFAGFLRVHQDYTSGYNNGGVFGLDLTQHFRLPVDASLEARVNLAPGNDVTERTYLFGPVVSVRLGRIRPYGDFLLGAGSIHFNRTADSTYTHDGSAVYDGGGGLEVGLVRNVRLKLDLQYQHWNLGHTDATVDTVFTPVLASAGISYTIPFRPFRRYSDPNYR